MDMYARSLKRFQIIPILLVAIFTLESQAFAGPAMQGQWLIGAGGGWAFNSLNTSTSVSNGTPVPAPFNTDIFSINTSDPAAAFALFGGYQWNRLSSPIIIIR